MLDSPPLQKSPPGSVGVKRSRSPDHSASIPSHPSIVSLRPSTAASHHQTDIPSAGSTSGQSSAGLGASSFRNVSACNRCRLRKNRCDQHLPRCQACEKARVKCVGYDPITKREIPRSYVYFLEARVTYLERLLLKNGVEFKPSAAFDGEAEGREKPSELEGSVGEELSNSTGALKSAREGPKLTEDNADSEREGSSQGTRETDGREQLEKLVSNIGMVSVQGTSDPRYLGSTSGISFARMVFDAVKSSVNHNGSDRSTVRPFERRPSTTGGSTMRDSFFGLQARPSMKPAAFPDRELAERLVELYFEHANPQMPILHRGDFMELLDRAYHTEERERAPRDQYLLNIVFAIGAGIIFEGKGSTDNDDKRPNRNNSPSARSSKKQKRSSHQYQPEEYHASAVIHLETFLGTSPTSEGFGAGLEELQAVLLVASFALLRPVSPGLWYIVGVAVRLAIDLGLHHEDGTGIDSIGEDSVFEPPPGVGDHGRSKIDPHERGRIEWARDSRRRLWWCVYSFDRLVSTCVGRPFGITDQVITTEFPSMLDDTFITKNGFVTPPQDAPSYKQVSYHYLKLRLLQSEIQQVLQYQQARYVRQNGKNSRNPYMHTNLPSPFLERFDSFRSWRRDVHRRLWEWNDSSPTQRQTGVQFSIEFFELNYYQALIMLYRQILTVPAALAGELTPTEDISSPPSFNVDEREDDDDIYLQVAEAGQKVIKIYRQLHRVRLVNYTYLATHHLFMAGISFLYAIWHSPAVRSRLTLDDVDFTVLAATSILGDLMEKCPPAEACRDAFERMSRATVRMGSSGFASQAVGGGSLSTPVQSWPSSSHPKSQNSRPEYGQSQLPSGQRRSSQRQTRPHPQFDMNLNDLFSQIPPSERQPPATRQRSSQRDRSSYAAQQAIQPDNSHEQYSSHVPYAPALNTYDQSPTQQQRFIYANSPQSISSGSAVQSFTPPLNPDQQDLSDVSLDLLDFTNLSQNPEASLDGNSSFNPMGVPSFGQGPQGNGLNMGFGMEVDYLRDISDVNGYDLMDGYWFGMPNANPGM